MDRLLAQNALGPVGWQWLDEATALPRRPRVWGRQGGTLQLIGTTLSANPRHLHTFFFLADSRETPAMPNPLVGVHGVFKKKEICFCNLS